MDFINLTGEYIEIKHKNISSHTIYVTNNNNVANYMNIMDYIYLENDKYKLVRYNKKIYILDPDIPYITNVISKSKTNIK